MTGGTILFTLDLSAPATVSGGTPELVLNDGGTATYDAAASVASDLVFNYTVQSGQSTDALSVSTLDLNGASIAGAGGNADLSNVAQNFPNLEVNALPSVTGIGVSATYTAGAAAAALDPGLKVTDPSSADLTGAIVQISSGVLAGDRLNFVDQNGIVGEVFIFNGATDELTLSGTASLADYQTALDSVTYSSTAADPTANGTDTSRTITWMVSDANGSSKLATSTIDVQLQPQPGPTLTVLTVSPYATADITTGQSITFTLRMSASVTVSGTPELILNDGGTAAYDAAASGGSDMVFDYTVQSGQSADVLAVSTIDLNGAGVIGAGGSANFPNAPFETFANLAVNVPQNINITWSNGTNGNWATSTDWSPIVIPGSTDNVIIEAGTVVINNGDNPFCKNLTLGSDATLTITQGSVLSISGGGDVNNAGVISVDQNSDLLANEDLTLTGGGSISLSGNSSVLSNGRATLTNYNNTISGAGAIDTFNFINGAGGLVEANVSGGALVLDPGNYSFVNDGEFVAHHGLLIVDIPVTGAGAATIEAAGTIDLRANDGQDVSFNGVGGVLDLGVPGEFSGIISGFVTGDTIVLTNDAYTSADQVSLGANNALTVAGANGPLASLQFNPSGSYSASDFSLVNAGGDVGIVNGSTAQSAPTLTALTASPDTGDITTGHSIAFTLDLSAPVTVSGGTPDLILNDGGTATYDAAASGTSDLVFDYTVQSGQSTDALAVSTLDLNGASITGAGGSADLSNVATSFPNLGINASTTISNSTTLLSDNFTQDSSLNANLFEINGPAATAALTNFDASPTATIIAPEITFSPTLGLGIGDPAGTYTQGGIQSTEAFSGPFTVTATGMATSIDGGPLQIAITSADGGSGIGIDAGQSANPQTTGFNYSLPSGPGTLWQTAGNLYATAPTLNVPYTFTISVGAAGEATVSVANNGTLLGSNTASVGTGPFYVVLSDGTGAYSSGSPNQAYWSNLQITGSNINTGISLSGEGNTVAYTAGGAAVAIDPNLGVSDATATDLVGASVVISHGFLSGDTLDFTNQNGISGSFDNTAGVLTLSGTASLADYQKALDSVSFGSSATDPTANGTDDSRTITWSVSDTSGSSIGATSTIDVNMNALVVGSATDTVLPTGAQINTNTALINSGGTMSLTGNAVNTRDGVTIDTSGLIDGYGVLWSDITNNGVLDPTGEELTVEGSITGTGTVSIGTSADVALMGAIGSGQTVAFLDGTGTLDLGDLTGFAGTIDNYQSGDLVRIDSLTITKSSVSIVHSEAIVSLYDGSTLVGTLDFSGAYTANNFNLSTSGKFSAITWSSGFSVTPPPGVFTGTVTPPPQSPELSGTIEVNGTAIEYPFGTLTIPNGGALDDGAINTTLKTPVIFSGNGTISAISGTTLALDGAITSGGTLALDGNVDMPDFSNGGTIYANGGADTIGALAKNIWVSAGPSAALTFLGHMGAATVFGQGGGLLEGGAGGDNVLVANGGATTVLGSTGGNDTLVGAAGTVMIAATPNDLVFAASNGGNDTVFGTASGTDTLVGGNAGAATLVGSTGNDEMWGGTGRDILFGGSGNETLGGGQGNTTVVAGTGASTLVGGSGDQEFVGATSGHATIFSGVGNTTLFSGGEALTAVLQNSGQAIDSIVLQSGDATIWGASGTNAGTDVYDVINGTAGGQNMIFGFKPGQDVVNLYGYSAGAAHIVANSGGTAMTLPDGTAIAFVGISSSQVAESLHYG